MQHEHSQERMHSSGWLSKDDQWLSSQWLSLDEVDHCWSTQPFIIKLAETQFSAYFSYQ